MDDRTAIWVLVGITVVLALALLISGVPSRSMGEAPPTREPSANETEYQTVVIFRNDDIEAGHRDDLRREVDQVFIDEGVPVTNAVIPTHHGEPLESDERFCRALAGQLNDHPDVVEYSLHGYLHEPSGDTYVHRGDGFNSRVQSEFAGLPYEEQHRRIAEGKRALSECVGETPRTFVPPYATYDDDTVRALASEDVGVVAGGSWFTEARYDESGHFETDGVLHVPETHGFVENWETEEFHDQSELRESFDDTYDDGGLYVQGLHYWTFDSEERRQELRSFVRYVKHHDGVLFMTLEGFADASLDGRLSQTDGGWTYEPPGDGSEISYETGG